MEFKNKLYQTKTQFLLSHIKKYVALILALIVVVPFVGCKESAVLEETITYQIESNVHSLEIRINATDFIIEQSEMFSVESNLKYLSVSEKDGVLTILDEAKNSSNYTDAKLTLYIPTDTVLEDVKITTGAAKMTVDTLFAKSLELQLGAGDVRVESLNVTSEVDIEGGAGEITILGGILHDLTLEMGLGELNLTAALIGNSDLDFGVGEANLALIGSKEDYKIDIKKGLGSITVDGETVSDFGSSENGENHVEIEGGVGAINLNFQAAELP